MQSCFNIVPPQGGDACRQKVALIPVSQALLFSFQNRARVGQSVQGDETCNPVKVDNCPVVQHSHKCLQER